MKKHIFSGIFIFSTLFTLSGCFTTNRILTKSDIVRGTKRYEVDFEYKHLGLVSRTPISSMEQSLVKEIGNGTVTYSVYDALTLSSRSYKLNEEVYVIVDEDEVFPMKIESLESDRINDFKQENQVLLSDSTDVSVVTKVSSEESKITRFGYKFPEELIERIQDAQLVQFRYYSGPDMITLKMKNNKLNKMKKLIEKQ